MGNNFLVCLCFGQHLATQGAGVKLGPGSHGFTVQVAGTLSRFHAICLVHATNLVIAIFVTNAIIVLVHITVII